MLCPHCSSDPCHRVTYGDHLRSSLSLDIPPNIARHNLYRKYTYAAYGHLGRGNRVVIPSCVVDLIRELHPSSNGEYMGHKEE